MPELPEVQTTVSGLDSHIRGLTLCDVWTSYNSAFHTGKDSIKDPKYFVGFKKALTGSTITKVTRRAKNVLIHIKKDQTESVILVHMKMTGHIMYGDYDRADPFNRFIRFIITFTNGKTLELSDMRKFAKVTLINEVEAMKSEHLAGIGPEPLDEVFSYEVFLKCLSRKPKGKIKTVLMDQSVIAGIGNIYSDEALWRASIHPETPAGHIDEIHLKKLYADILAVLRDGIDFGGDSMSDYRNIHGKRGSFQGQHQAYRKTGKPCTFIFPTKLGRSKVARGVEDIKGSPCTGVITRKVVGGRSAHFCNVHQKLF